MTGAMADSMRDGDVLLEQKVTDKKGRMSYVVMN
jgi:hypothetical protein